MKRTSLLVAGVAALLPSLTLAAQTTAPSKASPKSSAAAYYWYDGDRKQEVRVNDSLIAEFDSPSVSKSAVKKQMPDSQLQSSPSKRVRIWKMKSGRKSRDAAKQIREKQPSSKTSPLFEQKTPNSRKMALPGNIIVQFKPEWTEEQCSKWLDSKELKVDRKLDSMPNTYVVQSEPGIASLELANKLFETGELVGSSPDWWLESRAR